MHGRIAPLTRLAVLVLLLAAPGPARAHRLEAEYRVLPGNKVQVESWFDLTGDSPKGAQVRVYRADGQLLTDGKLDEQGLFVFSYQEPESLRVVVSAGAGHQKELMIPARALGADGTAAAPKEAPGMSNPPEPFADRGARVSVKDVLAGVGFLLALAAFVLSVRNARDLRRLQRHYGERLPRD